MPKSRIFSKADREIIIILHNIRSTFNVGAILRTAECLGLKQAFATGYTPNLEYCTDNNQPILPHIKAKLKRSLHVSALGAEEIVKFNYHNDISQLIIELKNQDYQIIGLEQNQKSIPLDNYRPAQKIALLLGEEVNGIDARLIDQCDSLIELAMFGQKESYNVAVATGICLYNLVTKP